MLEFFAYYAPIAPAALLLLGAVIWSMRKEYKEYDEKVRRGEIKE